MNTAELKALAEDLQINHEYCPKEVIHKASTAILELIAQLESAQGEIRVLRTTEAGLRERVKELEEGLADAAQSLCWLAFGECRNITDRPLLTALQVESAARSLLEKKE